MRSIQSKLTLAFLIIGLSGSFLVAFGVWTRTRSAFDQFLFNRAQQSLVDQLVEYYADAGSWEGVAYRIQPMSSPFGHQDPQHREWTRFIIVNPEQKIIYSMRQDQDGQEISKGEMEKAIPLTVNGKIVGWLILSSPTWVRIPNSPEDLFLRAFNRATLFSGVIALILAITLGGVLAFTMTRSLRELTDATMKIAQGKFGLKVKVRSKDELGKLAASFNNMSRELENATTARRQMTADIAHDLRSPLSVISGYTEALSDGKLEGTSEIYSILHQETRHLNRLIDDLRTLSLADAGELSLTLQVIEPQILLKRAASRHAVSTQHKQVKLIFEDNENLPFVNVDVDRMAQVLDNLILNSLRFTPPGGEIRLSARSEDQWLVFTIQDTGEGIDPNDLPHIFDRFYRGDKARQQNGESGLGLAIVRSMVEVQGGKVIVASAPGEGTTFTIYLPVNSSISS